MVTIFLVTVVKLVSVLDIVDVEVIMGVFDKIVVVLAVFIVAVSKPKNTCIIF